MKYFVYLTTNLVSGKQYIGSHKREINDTYLGSGSLISNEIKILGKNNFKREILELVKSRKEAFKLEYKYIQKI